MSIIISYNLIINEINECVVADLEYVKFTRLNISDAFK